MFYTDNPAQDAENEYASRTEIIGTCPFCHEWVTASDNYIRSYIGPESIAHAECVRKAEEEVNRFL